MANDSLDITRIDFDPLRLSKCKIENREQDLENSLEETQEHSAKIKEEKIEDEGVTSLH